MKFLFMIGLFFLMILGVKAQKGETPEDRKIKKTYIKSCTSAFVDGFRESDANGFIKKSVVKEMGKEFCHCSYSHIIEEGYSFEELLNFSEEELLQLNEKCLNHILDKLKGQ